MSIVKTDSKFIFLWKVLRQHQALLSGVIVIEVCLALLSAVLPYLTKLQVDQLQNQNTTLLGITNLSSQTVFLVLLLVPLSLELIRLVVFERFSRKLERLSSNEIRLTTEQVIWKKLDEMDAGFFNNERNQRILSSTMGSTRVVRDFFNFIKDRFKDSVTILAILPLLALVGYQLVILVFITSILQMLLSEFTRQQEVALNVLRDQIQERFWKVDSALTQDYHVLKMLGAVPAFLKQYYALSRERNEMEYREETAQETVKVFEWILSNGLTFLTNVYVGYQVLQGNMTIGTFVLVVSYTVQLNGMFKGLLLSTRNWKDIDLQYEKLRFFVSLKPRIRQDLPGKK